MELVSWIHIDFTDMYGFILVQLTKNNKYLNYVAVEQEKRRNGEEIYIHVHIFGCFFNPCSDDSRSPSHKPRIIYAP